MYVLLVKRQIYYLLGWQVRKASTHCRATSPQSSSLLQTTLPQLLRHFYMSILLISLILVFLYFVDRLYHTILSLTFYQTFCLGVELTNWAYQTFCLGWAYWTIIFTNLDFGIQLSLVALMLPMRLWNARIEPVMTSWSLLDDLTNRVAFAKLLVSSG